MLPIDVLCILGTRPEIIKFAPVIHALRKHRNLRTATVVSGQQADLIAALMASQDLTADFAFELMRSGEPFTDFMRRALDALLPLLAAERPRAVLVQGDTSTACAGALAAAFSGIPVMHIEAGLRSDDLGNPYPEEALRILVSHCATLHFAPTPANVRQLIAEGIPQEAVICTGNPIVDAVQRHTGTRPPSATVRALLEPTRDSRRIVLTLHRRENFGARISGYLHAIRDFIEAVPDATLVFPVHPNPNVRAIAADILSDHPRITLTKPLDYEDFLDLLNAANLIVSDSGGIQEECATLGLPLLVLRRVTERPEALASGIASLVPDATELARILREFARTNAWPARRTVVENPFGDGNSGTRIAAHIATWLAS